MPKLDVSELNIVLGVLGTHTRPFYVKMLEGPANARIHTRDLHLAVRHHLRQDQERLVLGRSS